MKISSMRIKRGSWLEKLSSLDELLAPGSVSMASVYHDDWCQIYKTGKSLDCNCNPDTEITKPPNSRPPSAIPSNFDPEDHRKIEQMIMGIPYETIRKAAEQIGPGDVFYDQISQLKPHVDLLVVPRESSSNIVGCLIVPAIPTTNLSMVAAEVAAMCLGLRLCHLDKYAVAVRDRSDKCKKFAAAINKQEDDVEFWDGVTGQTMSVN